MMVMTSSSSGDEDHDGRHNVIMMQTKPLKMTQVHGRVLLGSKEES
jgi:hypothetical protein